MSTCSTGRSQNVSLRKSKNRRNNGVGKNARGSALPSMMKTTEMSRAGNLREETVHRVNKIRKNQKRRNLMTLKTEMRRWQGSYKGRSMRER